MSASREHAPESMVSNKTREIIAILLVGFCLFAVCSTASYVDTTALSTSEGSGNLCGTTGQTFARFMLYGFGFASYAFYVCLGAWGVVLLTRKELPNFVSKTVGLVFFTIFLSAFLCHLLKGSPENIPGYGGLTGMFIDRFLTETLALGVVGARIILIVLFLITLILATDWIFFTSILALGRWVRERADSWRERAATNLAAAEKSAKAARARKVGEKAAVAAATAGGRKKEKALAELMKKEEAKQKRSTAIPADEDEGERREPKPDSEGAGADAEGAGREDADTTGGRKPVIADPSQSTVPTEAADVVGGAPVTYAPPTVKKVRGYKKPPLTLLDDTEVLPQGELEQMIAKTSTLLENTLQSFKIEAEVVEIQRGPVITMFELELAPGIKVERLRALEDNIAMAVKAPTVRIVAPIPGKSTAGIEVPNAMREMVRLKELFRSKKFRETKSAIPICLGKDAAGNVLIDDLAKMPHLLVAGSTGSGKSVCLNSIIMSILFTRNPEQVKMILVDPKMVELSIFKDIPHLMCPVVTEMKRAGAILEWATRLMDSRYSLLHMAGVRNIYAYNKLSEKELTERLGDLADDEEFQPYMPFIVIIVDELADLMMIGTREVEANITRLAQKSRAVGVHLVLATQRPSTNVITGLIKANMPTRIAFMVASKIDSRVILDTNGAEKLLGSGDMLYMPPHTSLVYRAQGTFVADGEVRDVANFLKEYAEPQFEKALTTGERKGFDPYAVDDLYEQAAEFIIETQRGSASLLQRHFSIGYTRASRLIDLMNQDGILGDYKGSQAREVNVTLEEWTERKSSREIKKV